MTGTQTAVSEELFELAQTVLPGGVSSPVRAFGGVGGHPRFVASAHGSTLSDVDGRDYIDMVMSWGPLLHGHAHPEIVRAVQAAAERGTSYGAPTEIEVRFALRLRELMPSLEMLRFVSSGTEAGMSALRLARAFTGRDGILKFDGCYHGHADALLVQAGSGALTHGKPTSAGVSQEATQNTWSIPYNDAESFQRCMRDHGSEVAAVIVEPIAGNMGTVPPTLGFLQLLREEASALGALLIFDEVITGFRVDLHGAQGLFGITPDLTCLGKIIGGGLPAAAFGGREEIMRLLSPLGPVYQAGTLSGNPVALAAGETSVDLASRADYSYLAGLAERLERGLYEAAQQAGIDVSVNRAQSMLSLFFTPGPVQDLASAQTSDAGRYGAFFHAMLDRGVYLPPSQYETWMLSFAHTETDVDAVVEAAGESMQALDR
jgi:glutamate-1-semialdehyde 2,1-aminomutase